MSSTPRRVDAQAFVPASGSVVETAEALTSAILPDIHAGRAVEISMQGLAGVSSSFFNVIFQRVADSCGLDAIDQLLRFQGASSFQTQVLERSRAATRKRFHPDQHAARSQKRS